MENNLKIAFVCTHNANRSQIAEALGKHFLSGKADFFSAGTTIATEINPNAVRLIKEIYGINMEETQFPKELFDLPPIDILITMGCGVSCPTLKSHYREDWGLDDPSGEDDTVYRSVIREIEQKLNTLGKRIDDGYYTI